MRGLRKMLARFALLVAVLTVISALLGPSTPQRSPYVSALADLTVGSALAAPACHHRVCNRGGTACNKVSRDYNCVLGTPCTNVACPV